MNKATDSLTHNMNIWNQPVPLINNSKINYTFNLQYLKNC